MRSKSMQSLTDDVKDDHPGVVIYGIGDAAHKTHPSGHNEDDTPGSLPEMQDADNDPEHRAIDVMLGPAFTKAEAYALIAYILARPALLKRLIYIIFNGWIWSKSHGWVKREFDGDPHDDHIHFSGDAADDNNTDPWLEGTMAESYSPFTKPTAAGDRPTILFAAEMWRLLRDGAQGVYDTTLPARGGLLKRLDRIEDALARLEAKPAGNVDEAALAELLIPHLPEGADAAAVAAAVGPVLRAELDKTRLGGS